MKAVAMKMYYVDSKGDIKQEVVIAPSKMAVTLRFKENNLEILKAVDVTDKYMFTKNSVIEALGDTFSNEQRELLGYILEGAGVK